MSSAATVADAVCCPDTAAIRLCADQAHEYWVCWCNCCLSKGRGALGAWLLLDSLLYENHSYWQPEASVVVVAVDVVDAVDAVDAAAVLVAVSVHFLSLLSLSYRRATLPGYVAIVCLLGLPMSLS